MKSPIYIMRDEYPTYYRYRKAIAEYRDRGFVVRNVCGGVICFRFYSEYAMWRKQR